MSTSPDEGNVRIVRGDLLKSRQQAVVNTVNTVGVMGKGIALAFKKRYPEMYLDYVRRCDRDEVRLGEPYAYQADDHLIINFPTKGHWRSVSRLDDIIHGLEHLKAHYKEWGVESIAVPPLGCGNGQLEWDVVKRELVRHLSELDIPVELYAPHDATPDQLALPLVGDEPVVKRRPVEAPWLAWVQILASVEAEPYHWPIGRIYAQKIAYFASAAGIPLPLTWKAESFGPFAEELKRGVATLQNNGLVAETQRGQMFELHTGPTAQDAFAEYAGELAKWETAIGRTVDLVCRFSTKDAEVAATVHYVASVLAERFGREPFAKEVIAAVEKWKIRRTPAITPAEVAESIVALATQRWIQVQPDDSLDFLLAETA